MGHTCTATERQDFPLLTRMSSWACDGSENVDNTLAAAGLGEVARGVGSTDAATSAKVALRRTALRCIGRGFGSVGRWFKRRVGGGGGGGTPAGMVHVTNTAGAAASAATASASATMTKSERAAVGRMVKTLLDTGRMEWLRERGMEGRLVGYVHPSVSPENRLIVVSARGSRV
jgi:hypothetical protein